MIGTRMTQLDHAMNAATPPGLAMSNAGLLPAHDVIG